MADTTIPPPKLPNEIYQRQQAINAPASVPMPPPIKSIYNLKKYSRGITTVPKLTEETLMESTLHPGLSIASIEPKKTSATDIDPTKQRLVRSPSWENFLGTAKRANGWNNQPKKAEEENWWEDGEYSVECFEGCGLLGEEDDSLYTRGDYVRSAVAEIFRIWLGMRACASSHK